MNIIPVAQCNFITTDDRDPYRIFGGTQDDAALYGPSNASLDPAMPDPWKSVYLDRWNGGDSYVTLPEPTDDRWIYYEHQNGDMLRMDITGATAREHWGAPGSGAAPEHRQLARDHADGRPIAWSVAGCWCMADDRVVRTVSILRRRRRSATHLSAVMRSDTIPARYSGQGSEARLARDGTVELTREFPRPT